MDSSNAIPQGVIRSNGSNNASAYVYYQPGVVERASRDSAQEGTPGNSSEADTDVTAVDAAKYRKVSGKIPSTAWLLCLVEMAERATYYGSSLVYNNFMEFKLPKGSNDAGAPPKGMQMAAGALGKGLQFSSALVLTIKFVIAITPVFGAWLADAKIGRFRGILLGVVICAVAHFVQIIGGLPSVIHSGHALGPFLTSALLLAIGAGIIRPCLLPTILDQYTNQEAYVTRRKTGDMVIVDPETTINRMTLYITAFVNVGALFPIVTVYAEKLVGFWLSFVLSDAVFLSLPLLLWWAGKRMSRARPQGSEISNFLSIVATAFRRKKGKFWQRDFLESAKPSVMRNEGYVTFIGKPVPWDDKLVEDVRRTIAACTMFLYFPVWHLNNGGVGSIVISQASTLTTNGAPNDLLHNFNPITVLILVPVLSHLVYPTLRRFNMMPGRITRITFGFVLGALSSLIGCLIQVYIYRTSPCGKHATHCQVGSRVSPISVWVQVPVFVLGAASECFSMVTAFEIAYARSPKSMKAIVMSIFLLMNAVSSAMGTALTPLIKDPLLPFVWAGPGCVMLLMATHFYWTFRKLNQDEFMTREEEMVAESKSLEAGCDAAVVV